MSNCSTWQLALIVTALPGMEQGLIGSEVWATVRAALFWLVAQVVGIGTLAVSDYNHHMPFLNRPILLYRGVKHYLLLIVGDVTKALTNAGPT